MTQKNLKSKFNFFMARHRKSQAHSNQALFCSSHNIATERKSQYQQASLVHQSSLNSEKLHYGILKQQQTPITSKRNNFNRTETGIKPPRKRVQSQLNRSGIQSSKFVPAQKTYNFLKPISTIGPKLRQTGSTLCQSPKANILNLKQSRVSQFHKIKTLGKGRFGQVYLVKHKKTGFVGALKVIDKSDLFCGSTEQNEKAMKQLIRQIKLQAFLNHPNLIKLYDFFSDEDNVYLFLELACDGPLFDLLEEHHTFSEQTTSVVIREVVQGVHYMHKRDIIHRDIKLQNIVLCHGMAKICDFGWSVHCPKEFRSTICGTPLYLSPQILMGMQYNKKIDSWAIGALTHQLFTSDNPFKIKNKQELSKIVTQDFQMENGSPELRSFITFILKKNPSKRPDTETILRHPFIHKYRDLETSEQLFQWGK